MNKLSTLTAVLSLLLFSCSSSVKRNNTRHSSLMINGSDHNKLEVLDWGGEGQPVIFLSGMGNTAHVFDSFALRFTDRFHVYGLTRRGFGLSGRTADYSETSLAKDILAVIDSLHIGKVILIGHSIAGEEISKFASSYPDRMSKAIYLDAAYDRTTPDFKTMLPVILQIPVATLQDSSSFAHWKAFNKKTYGVAFPDEELQQTTVFSADGKYLHEATPDSIIGAMGGGVESPDYAHIRCPALAIYAKYSAVSEAVPAYAAMDPGHQQSLGDFFSRVTKYALTEQTRFKNGVRNGSIKIISDHPNHYIFISNPAETEKMIRDFLQ